MYDILIRKIAHKASKRYSSSNCVICIDDYIISSSHLDWLYCTVLQFKSVNVSHIACHTFPPLLLLLPSFFLSFLQPSYDIDPRENSRLSTVGYRGQWKDYTLCTKNYKLFEQCLSNIHNYDSFNFSFQAVGNEKEEKKI